MSLPRITPWMSLLLVGVCAATAAAQPGMAPAGAPANPAAAPIPGDERSPALAVAVSAGLGLVGAGLLVERSPGPFVLGSAILWIGPTLGTTVAGDTSYAGFGLRTLGMLIVAGPVSQGVHGDDARVPVISGGIVIAAGTVLDVYKAGTTARRHNERLRDRATVTPIATPTGGALVVGGTW